MQPQYQSTGGITIANQANVGAYGAAPRFDQFDNSAMNNNNSGNFNNTMNTTMFGATPGMGGGYIDSGGYRNQGFGVETGFLDENNTQFYSPMDLSGGYVNGGAVN